MKIYRISRKQPKQPKQPKLPKLIELKIQVGKKYWFEYHCWESEESADAELWHHSHQQCLVTGIDVEYKDMTIDERYEAAMLNHYKIQFADGFASSAGEDELMASRSEFTRPNPPPKPKTPKK